MDNYEHYTMKTLKNNSFLCAPDGSFFGKIKKVLRKQWNSPGFFTGLYTYKNKKRLKRYFRNNYVRK